LTAAAAAVCLSGDVVGEPSRGPVTEVVVTLRAPSGATVFGRALRTSAHTAYLRRLDAQQAAVSRLILSRLPDASIRWHYRLVANGLAVVLPHDEIAQLARVPGVAEVWPSVTYHSLRTGAGPQQIGADKLWGPTFATAGQGMKIGIIDDGVDAAHPYFNPSGYQYPAGFPKGQTRFATPKVIVQRTFTPAHATNKNASLPFDPANSEHATHVAGIAAGDHGVNANGTLISGVAPNAWIGNYKALTTPTPGFGLDGNSPEITAAIEAAVADGMNVINLSLGEPEVEPSRDLVVQAIDRAAAAGVVPVIAAGNDFGDFGYGSIGSPGSARDAITVAAVDARNTIADFSSGGPTPVSLQMKPDVAAPGVNVLSSVPTGWASWEGTSMATPHVSGAAALLKERHPTWTVAQIKSALVQSGDPVRTPSGDEALATREGGGVVDLVKADVPLLFASPTGLSFGRLGPNVTASRSVVLTDAGGGAGTWSVTTRIQRGDGAVSVPSTVAVPGTLTVTATGGAAAGDEAGFIVLARGSDVRRIPFWFITSIPKLAREHALVLTRRGLHTGTTAGAQSLVSSYRYPTGGDDTYPGPERVYRFRVVGRPANAGVVVLSGRVSPHVTFNGSEDHLAGYTGLPLDINPYRDSYGDPRPIAGLVLPAPGLYDVVFDSRAAGGAPFTFRYWVNDVTPPRLKITSRTEGVTVSARDAGSGVDPESIVAVVDGKSAAFQYRNGAIHVETTPGRHRLVLTVSDYQEAKNMEDVGPILPNTATLKASVRVRAAG
jgi:subtilisin family serine protease